VIGNRFQLRLGMLLSGESSKFAFNVNGCLGKNLQSIFSCFMYLYSNNKIKFEFQKIKSSIRIHYFVKKSYSEMKLLSSGGNWTEHTDDIRLEARLMPKKVARDPRTYVINLILKQLNYNILIIYPYVPIHI